MDGSVKFRTVLSAILGIAPERVTDDLSAEAVDTWDSLNHINIIGALEQEFGVSLPADHLGNSMSVARLKGLLAQHGVTV